MGVDDYMDREAGAIAAATAAVVSPRARELLRRGAVYGLAGLLKAGDVAVAAARGAVKGAKDGASGTTQTASKPTASRSRQTRRSGGTAPERSSRSGSGSSRSMQSRSRRRTSSSASKT
jgi:hypothetical protein